MIAVKASVTAVAEPSYFEPVSLGVAVVMANKLFIHAAILA